MYIQSWPWLGHRWEPSATIIIFVCAVKKKKNGLCDQSGLDTARLSEYFKTFCTDRLHHNLFHFTY